MKKQNPNNKLVFNRTAVAELNANQMKDVNGGTSSSTLVGTTSLVTISVVLTAE